MVDKTFATAYFEKNREQILKDYFTLVGFPTIGAEAKHLGDCARAAAWLKQFLRPLGFAVELLTPKSGVPVPLLFAERKTEGMDVLFYGHYDVQPPDPLDQWKTKPFEPTLVNGRVYARGAQDDKGQFFSFLYGMKALIEAGEKLPTIRILLEGEEENGSYGISELLPGLANRIPAHVLLVADTSAASDDRPAIIAGLRGVQHFQITLTGPRQDVHSGVHGGLAPNPAQGIAHLLASLHHSDGSIAVDGFRDDVTQPTAEELAFAHESAESAEQYERETGCPWAGGAKGVDPVIRGCFEPTIEVNGVHSGYGGAGSKTVIPSTAIAKLSMRLVPDQSPARVFKALKRHLQEHCPRGMKMELSEVFEGLPGFRLSTDSPVFRLAADVLKELDPRGAVFRWEGASIPIVSQIKQLTGAAPLLVGFGRETDNIHSPNESYGLDQFQRCMTWGSLILSELAK
jgi:acetylornithine deacetylase/succinyl-diaminopimelate desuccinylase-like protein